jgi:flagellar biosynthesis/type III secretory pathway protein FliH
MQFITSWERKGRAEGIEQGRTEGIEQGRTEGIEQGRTAEARNALLDLLQEKFGTVPETTIHRVEAISSIGDFRRLLRQLIHADSLAEMGLDGAEK